MQAGPRTEEKADNMVLKPGKILASNPDPNGVKIFKSDFGRRRFYAYFNEVCGKDIIRTYK